MRPRPALITPCLLAAALTLTACSDSPSAQEELTWEDSPLNTALADFFGGDQSPEEFEREEAERQRKVEEMIAECMAGEGFEYTPVIYDTGTYFDDDTIDEMDTAEWAEQYGYGITTDPWGEEQPMESEEEWLDPNSDYLEAMSPSEQDAYFEALYGPSTFVEGEEEWGEEEEFIDDYSWEEAGCQGSAHHEVYEQGENGEEMWEDPAFTEFFGAAEKLYEDTMRDPRITEINAEWAGCMADAGMSGMTTPDDVNILLYEEYEQLYTEADAQVDWDNIDWEALAPTADPVRDAMDAAGLAELREREIATAVADHACQEELNTESRYLAIQFEREEEFVSTYQAEIDALKAAYGQGS